MKVWKTKNYKMFKINDLNRRIQPRPKLVESLKEHGYFPYMPIICRRDGDFFVVEDGHHRLHYASSLGLDVYYIESDDADFRLMRVDAKSEWTAMEMIVSYSDRGDEEYVYLTDFMKRNHLNASLSTALLLGKTSTSTSDKERIRGGKFERDDGEHASKVTSITNLCHEIQAPFATKTPFVQALSLCVLLPDFDHSYFRSKIVKFASMISIGSTRDHYVAEIEKVYNHKRMKGGKALPIVFQVNEAKKARGSMFGKGEAK